jgi:hypothetical protein
MKTNQQPVESANKYSYERTTEIREGTRCLIEGISFSGPWGRILVREDGKISTPKKGSEEDAVYEDDFYIDRAKEKALRILSGERWILAEEG